MKISFCDYYSQWISVYKEGAIREVTMESTGSRSLGLPS